MTQAAQPLKMQRSRRNAVWDAIRGRDEAQESPLDETISFGELVWAHHERQEKEVYRGTLNGPLDQEYRRRLKLFKQEHGDIMESYWCRYEASGVALTEMRLPRRLSNFFRRDSVLRLHTATDWRTENAPTVAMWLHRWETAAIKVSEVLRDTSERIALHWIFAASSRLLGFVDRKSSSKASDANLAIVLREQENGIEEVKDYYARAGENSARIVYFRGMIWGTAVLAILVGGSFLLAWAFGWLDPRDEPTYTLFVTIAMGAAGAILSVMTRMARQDGFNLEFEVGRKSMRYLGGLRPWIGALFAFALYLALKSKLVDFIQNVDHGIYFYATAAFLAGFSERRAKVLLDSAAGESDSDTSGGPKKRTK